MSAAIYFEGGGNSEATQSIHRRGLRAYCEKLTNTGNRPKIVAGGGRSQTFDKFERAARNCGSDDAIALLVDSEEPVAAGAAEHLNTHDGWDLALLRRHKVFLMVQTMEAWFLADRDALAAYYNGGFAPNALPKSGTGVEAIRKAVIEPGLNHAVRQTKRERYRKIEHGSDLMAAVDPAKVEACSRHAADFNRFLRSL